MSRRKRILVVIAMLQFKPENFHAGGGFMPGLVIGSSDAQAEYPLNRPIKPADLFSTVLHQIGITTTRLTGVGITPLGHLVEELM